MRTKPQNKIWEKQNKWQGKPVRQMSTQQLPYNAKINLTAIKPRLISNSGRIHTNNGDKSPVSRVDESALRQWINYHNKAPGGIKLMVDWI